MARDQRIWKLLAPPRRAFWMACGAKTCGVSRATWIDDFESGKRPCHHHLHETELITSERDGYIVVRNLLKYGPKDVAHDWYRPLL